jgi:hypothetical protein
MTPDAIPLSRALLCANCEVISGDKSGTCVACGSTAVLSLARVLNPKAGKLVVMKKGAAA